MGVQSKELLVNSILDLKNFVHKILLPQLTKRQVILLSGPLGAGKTQLVKLLCEEYGIHHSLSPTFAICNHYRNLNISIDHIDLYRLKDHEDLESTGFYDLFENKSGIIVIEWADRLSENDIPFNWSLIKIEIEQKEDIRKLKYKVVR